MFQDIPIKRKLIAAMLLICGAVLFISGASFFVYEYLTVKRSAQKQLSIIGNIVAANSTAALAFGDEAAARETLESLRSQPHITAAALYNADGSLFIRYKNATADSLIPPRPGPIGYAVSNAHIEGFEPVQESGKLLGTLFIRSDLKEFHAHMMLLAAVSLSLLIVSLIVAWALAGHFQRGISRPIIALVNTSKSVSNRHDYTVRAQKFGNDELGILTDAFNNMLAQIESQNAEITSFNQQLEHKVELRTSELASANRELESFSYSVSHDLRAPLRKINSFINMFMERFKAPLEPDNKLLLDRIVANSNKMGKLIDDLLAFARIGKLELERKSISMNGIVKGLTDEISRQEGGRRIRFRVKDLPQVTADHTAITQVWENLITNAVKYTANRDKAVIDIDASVNDGEIIYCIRDNGSGFDMRHYEKLFTAFERLHSNSEFEGTGVGLAIVQRILEKHGGRIWAESEKDKGATFFFSLPNS